MGFYLYKEEKEILSFKFFDYENVVFGTCLLKWDRRLRASCETSSEEHLCRLIVGGSLSLQYTGHIQ